MYNSTQNLDAPATASKHLLIHSSLGPPFPLPPSRSDALTLFCSRPQPQSAPLNPPRLTRLQTPFYDHAVEQQLTLANTSCTHPFIRHPLCSLRLRLPPGTRLHCVSDRIRPQNLDFFCALLWGSVLYSGLHNSTWRHVRKSSCIGVQVNLTLDTLRLSLQWVRLGLTIRRRNLSNSVRADGKIANQDFL